MAGGSSARFSRNFRTIGDLIQEVFPDGTNVAPTKGEGFLQPQAANPYQPWRYVPLFAADVFAFCAHVINHIGAMGYVKVDVPTSHVKNGQGNAFKIVIGLDHPLRENAVADAKQWRSDGSPPDTIQAHWDSIFEAWFDMASIALYRGRSENGELIVRNWWTALFSLLISADEACEGLGHFVFDEEGVALLGAGGSASSFFQPHGLVNKTPDNRGATFILGQREKVDSEAEGPGKINTVSYGVMANPAVICVQPKCRVTSVGCSLRNLSRNLAAVGPAGSVRCNWRQLGRPTNGEKPGQLNLLLIPIPYEIKGNHFHNTGRDTFGIRQAWLPKNDAEREIFVKRIAELVEKACEEADIHGVLFPEYALDYDTVVAVRKAIFAASRDSLMFMVSGSSRNCEREPGNIVMTQIWDGVCCREKSTSLVHLDRKAHEFSQRKHQRWLLEEGQIGTYGLGSRLDPGRNWWEDHDIGRRELHFFQIAEDTVFTSLICEDLARNDPCHDIIRAVAPNLVFALLMDGPQLATRWPARFAGSLADDPGCTVLTFTSYGLIERSNFQFPEGGKSVIGLLRDSSGRATEISLPKGRDAVIVSLQSQKANDKTMDGRQTKHASKWKFVTQQPISIGLR